MWERGFIGDGLACDPVLVELLLLRSLLHLLVAYLPVHRESDRVGRWSTAETQVDGDDDDVGASGPDAGTRCTWRLWWCMMTPGSSIALFVMSLQLCRDDV